MNLRDGLQIEVNLNRDGQKKYSVTAVLTPEPVNIQFPDGIRVQDDLTLQTVVIDGNRQKLEERIDRDDHGQRLCI